MNEQCHGSNVSGNVMDPMSVTYSYKLQTEQKWNRKPYVFILPEKRKRISPWVYFEIVVVSQSSIVSFAHLDWNDSRTLIQPRGWRNVKKGKEWHCQISPQIMYNINSCFPLLFASLLIGCRHIEETDVSNGKDKFMDPTRSFLQRTLTLEKQKQWSLTGSFKTSHCHWDRRTIQSYPIILNKEESIVLETASLYGINATPQRRFGTRWTYLFSQTIVLVHKQISFGEANHRGTNTIKTVRDSLAFH